MNEEALKDAAQWAATIKEEKKRGLPTENMEFELMAFMLSNGLQSFLNIDFKALEKQL